MQSSCSIAAIAQLLDSSLIILTLLSQLCIAALSGYRSLQRTCFRVLHGPNQGVTQTHCHARIKTWHVWSPEECIQWPSRQVVRP